MEQRWAVWEALYDKLYIMFIPSLDKSLEGLDGAWSKYETVARVDTLDNYGFHLETRFKAGREQSKLAIKANV